MNSANAQDRFLFSMKHATKSTTFEMPIEGTTISDLKHKIQELTDVLPVRQKIVGLYAPSVKDESSFLSQVICNKAAMKAGKPLKFVMLGTPESKIIKDPHELESLPDVVNDLDWDYSAPGELEAPQYNLKNIKRLKKKLQTVDVHLMHPPRRGKKLVVIDIDYTIFDCKSKDLPISVVKRPFTDQLLENIYQHFDIVFWSQTHWRWVEAKLTEMGLLTNPRFKVTFILDRTSMFSIRSTMPNGKKRKHEVKPLRFIWEKFPEYYNERNTVHLDDLSRNFAMNPRNGIKVKAYKRADKMRANDRELLLVDHLLMEIVAPSEDVTKLDLRHWRELVQARMLSSSNDNE